jgi:hypothetical protein
MRTPFMVIIANIGCLFLLSQCSKEGGGSSSGRGGASATSSDGVLAGQLVISEGAPEDSIEGAEITAVGHPEFRAKTEADGSFQVEAPAGTLQVIVTSSADGELALASPEYGIKLDEIEIIAGETTDTGENEMKKTGSISGTVEFFENPNDIDKVGSEIFIPGTSFIAKSDDDGSFSLAGLPEGTYDLRVQHEGMSSSDLEDVEVVSGETTDLGTILLSLSKGPEGGIAIAADATADIGGTTYKIKKTRTVEATLTYDSDAVLMKVSDEPTFLNKSWVAVDSSVTWEFDSDGLTKLYVKYSDLNGLESSPYSTTFYVDTEVPTVNSIALLYGWSQISSTATKTTTTVDASDTGTGVAQFMLSNSSNFATNSGWLDYVEVYNNWTPATDTWVKVRDYAGRVSAAVTDHINQGTYSVIPPGVIESDLTLRKSQSPYSFTGSVEVEGDLTVEAGVTIMANLSSISSFLIKGKTVFDGTVGDPITFSQTGSEFQGFDLSQSKAEDNRISYVNSGTQTEIDYLFVIDGGGIYNCDLEGAGVGVVKKVGFRSTEIMNNTLYTDSGPTIRLEGGTNAVTISGNEITAKDRVITHAGDSGTLVEYNTIDNIRTDGMPSPGLAVKIESGGATYQYNAISSGDSSTDAAAFIVMGTTTNTLEIEHNNIIVLDKVGAAHIYNDNPNQTITADSNHYAGCGATCTVNENPHWLGSETGTITNTNNHTIWPTTGTKASGCVGHQCTN